jgi:hypothetical protein
MNEMQIIGLAIWRAIWSEHGAKTAGWSGAAVLGSIESAKEWVGLLVAIAGLVAVSLRAYREYLWIKCPAGGMDKCPMLRKRLEESKDAGTKGTFGVLLFLLVAMLIASGCSALSPTPRPQKGGAVVAKIPVVQESFAGKRIDLSQFTSNALPQIVIEAEQPENPNTPTENSYTRTTARPDGTSTTEEFRSVLGTTQHDKARDDWGGIAMAATKLKAARLPQILGFLLILASLAMFHPAVKAVTMSSTLQWVTGGVGLALVFLSPMFATMDATLIMVGIGGPAAYYFIWKHGRLQGEIDANKNGIPDRLEPKPPPP